MWWPAWTALLVVVVGGGGTAKAPGGGEGGEDEGQDTSSRVARHRPEHEDPMRYYNDVTNLTSSTYLNPSSEHNNKSSNSSATSPASSGSYPASNRSYSTSHRSSSSSNMSCEEARIKCALRNGCGMALQNYMLGCSDLMSGRIEYCDEYCKNSLIALTSTEEGHALMDCICSDDYCRETKARVEVCREEVIVANADSSVVSCSVAHWICAADAQCSTAIGYYDHYCRRMFLGKV
ncbi:1,3-beta-glucanosyltransferase gas1, partial [Halocaridina rubra]